MKIRRAALAVIMSVAAFFTTACSDQNPFNNPGDVLGGGGVAEYVPTESGDDSVSTAVEDIVSSVVVDTVEEITGTQVNDALKITESGDYVISGDISGKINVKAENVRLILNNANIVNDKKAIESDYALTIILAPDSVNTVTNTLETDAKSTIDCAGDLVISGSGTLKVESVKHGIKANSITVSGSSLSVESASDALHAEVDAYDDITLTSAPTLNYDDGGFVYIDGANLTLVSGDDGISADTFVYVKGESVIDIRTNGGSPSVVTETSSDNADGKGIKAGPADWGAEDENGDRAEIDSDAYAIIFDSGEFTIDANDDAVHSDGYLYVNGGEFTVNTGDDGFHADLFVRITGGNIAIGKSYEGIEAARVEIAGGVISVVSSDDGINAADGTQTQVNVANTNCHIVISGGTTSVNASGDGVDSNGSILLTGGKLFVSGSTSGSDAAMDADGNIIVNGGYLFAVGALGMVETPASNSEQYVVSFAHQSTMQANTNISLTNSDGDVIFNFVTPKSCQSVIISCPELQKGSSYAIYGGDTKLSTFTVSSIITSIGSSGGIGTPGGFPGGGRR